MYRLILLTNICDREISLDGNVPNWYQWLYLENGNRGRRSSRVTKLSLGKWLMSLAYMWASLFGQRIRVLLLGGLTLKPGGGPPKPQVLTAGEGWLFHEQHQEAVSRRDNQCRTVSTAAVHDNSPPPVFLALFITFVYYYSNQSVHRVNLKIYIKQKVHRRFSIWSKLFMQVELILMTNYKSKHKQ